MVELAWMATGFGLLGLLVECIFTGVSAALFDNDRAGTCKTYLCMFPLYAVAGLVLHWIRLWWPLPILLAGLVYVPIIYTFEFSYGWFWKKVFGYCPWDYSGSKWSVKGFIRLDFCPYWYGLALAFAPVSAFLERAFRVLG